MNNLLEQDIITMEPTFIFVDGSYYNFYRYFALMQWWKNAYPDEPLTDPYQNEKFVDKCIGRIISIFPKKYRSCKLANGK